MVKKAVLQFQTVPQRALCQKLAVVLGEQPMSCHLLPQALFARIDALLSACNSVLDVCQCIVKSGDCNTWQLLP